MLGGEHISDTTLAHALELLQPHRAAPPAPDAAPAPAPARARKARA
jgi:hypothetical protein